MQESETDDKENKFFQDVSNFSENHIDRPPVRPKNDTGVQLIESLIKAVGQSTGGNFDTLKAIGKDLSKLF